MKMLKERNKWFPDGSRHHEKMTERVWKVVNVTHIVFFIDITAA